MLDEKDLQVLGLLMDQKLNPVHQQLAGIEGRLEHIEQDMTILKKDVSVLKEDVTGLKEDVTGLKKKVSSLERETKRIRKQMDARFCYLDEAVKKVDRRLEYNIKLLIRADREIMRDVAALERV